MCSAPEMEKRVIRFEEWNKSFRRQVSLHLVDEEFAKRSAPTFSECPKRSSYIRMFTAAFRERHQCLSQLFSRSVSDFSVVNIRLNSPPFAFRDMVFLQ